VPQVGDVVHVVDRRGDVKRSFLFHGFLVFEGSKVYRMEWFL
jgi:hypothetical protein